MADFEENVEVIFWWCLVDQISNFPLGTGHKLKSPWAGGDFENSQKFSWPHWNFMENFMTPPKFSKKFRDPTICQTSFSYMFSLVAFTPNLRLLSRFGSIEETSILSQSPTYGLTNSTKSQWSASHTHTLVEINTKNHLRSWHGTNQCTLVPISIWHYHKSHAEILSNWSALSHCML